MSMKISNDTIGNRTRDLPASSAVPQSTAPPCTPFPGGSGVEKGPIAIVPPRNIMHVE
jgi:hypothetical protein